MPSAEAKVPHNRKRQLSEAEPETCFSSQPTAKRQKLEDHRRHRTPSSFWDNLSRQWLTRRTLREFDRRTVWPTVPLPSYPTGKENINLTKLKRSARHGGPNLSDIRGYPDPETSVPSNPTMSGSRKRAKTGSKSGASYSTRRTSAYDYGFGQHLIDYGIYPEGYNDDEEIEEPVNIEDINHRLAQPRPSLSPSQFTREQFLDFKKKNREALTESKVMSKAFPIIAGTADIPSQENLRFTNLKDLTDGSITQAQPDFYDGARPEELDRQIRDELGPYIIPSTNTAVPCLPNFFTEGKGPKGLTDVAKNQAMYDGALGARGIHELRSYVDPETAYNNKAYTITSTYHPSGLLTMYTTHPVKSTNPKYPTEYRMTQLKGWHMASDLETFRQGTTFWRNGRDLTRDGRKGLIAAANTKALNTETPGLNSSSQSLMSLLSDEPALPDSETSADELVLDLGVFHSSNHTTPVQARTKAPPKGSSNGRLNKSSRIKKNVHDDSRNRSNRS